MGASSLAQQSQFSQPQRGRYAYSSTADDTTSADTFAYATEEHYADPAATTEEYSSFAAQAADEYYEPDISQAFIATEGAYDGGYEFVDAYGVPFMHK